MSGIAIELKTYDDVIALINRRLADLQVTMAELDERAGLQTNYASKVLRRSQIKKIGPVSFTMFEAVGIRLFALQNDEATARTLARRTPRQHCHVQRKDAHPNANQE